MHCIGNFLKMSYKAGFSAFIIVWGYDEKTVSSGLFGRKRQFQSCLRTISPCSCNYGNTICYKINCEFSEFDFFFRRKC